MFTHELVHFSIAVVSAWIAATASGQTCRAKSTLQRVCSTSVSGSLRYLNTLSSVSCVLECNQDTACRSFMFNPSTDVCVTYSGKSTGFPSSCSNNDMVYYGEIEMSTCTSSWINDACSVVNTDCTTPPSSQCYNNRCRCLSGYSPRRVPDSCHSYCPAPGYGSMWTEEFYYLTFNNRQAFYGTPSLDACKAHCLEATTFTCRFIEYVISDGECQISDETGYSKPNDVVVHANPDWVQYIRNCY